MESKGHIERTVGFGDGGGAVNLIKNNKDQRYQVKPEYPGANLSEKSRESTNSKHMASNPESKPRHFGGRRLLSFLRKPSDPQKKKKKSREIAQSWFETR